MIPLNAAKGENFYDCRMLFPTKINLDVKNTNKNCLKKSTVWQSMAFFGRSERIPGSGACSVSVRTILRRRRCSALCRRAARLLRPRPPRCPQCPQQWPRRPPLRHRFQIPGRGRWARLGRPCDLWTLDKAVCRAPATAALATSAQAWPVLASQAQGCRTRSHGRPQTTVLMFLEVIPIWGTSAARRMRGRRGRLVTQAPGIPGALISISDLTRHLLLNPLEEGTIFFFILYIYIYMYIYIFFSSLLRLRQAFDGSK